MERFIEDLMVGMPWFALGAVIVLFLLALGKGANLLVDEAVGLSSRWGVPKSVIGATIVSLGTTTPEATVSVMAALRGSPGLALGNAVGSIICDTGLILGLAALIAPLRLDKAIVNRQGWIQLGAGILLVAACWPWKTGAQAFTSGGNLPQTMGFLFIFLLLVYLGLSIFWARETGDEALSDISNQGFKTPIAPILLKLSLGISIVLVASWIVIPAVKEAAHRLHVPEGIIAATLVAFGTSLPELATAITAARRGHGELAIGNVVGADILNVLFVAGASAAVSPGGLTAPSSFFRVFFPAMLFVLITFRVGIFFSQKYLKRSFGVVLLAAYLIATIAGFR